MSGENLLTTAILIAGLLIGGVVGFEAARLHFSPTKAAVREIYKNIPEARSHADATALVANRRESISVWLRTASGDTLTRSETDE